ncbi:MAG: acetylornithine/succinylornithine family transaminase [Bacteroidetes bacterium]|nr:acetylornithine/succinylornithine family transaminase [Bacteroidota bacterium]
METSLASDSAGVTAHQEETFGLGVYARRGLVLCRGENAFVWDAQGRRYIDCIAGHGSANIGHAHLAVTSAVVAQSMRLLACSNVFYNDIRGEYLRLLLSVAPDGLRRAFLCNSGTEAIEAAIKFARHVTGRVEIISTFRAFHGRTLGSLSATHNPAYRNGFGPLLPGVTFVPYNDSAALVKAISGETAAVVLEIVQGEGGVHVGTRDFLSTAARLCAARGALLILDEVQTGFGRTGRLFACEHFDLTPDILCLAKSIAGGLPMGAVLCSERITMPPGSHGSTFGGNPLCCAAAYATLQVLLNDDIPKAADEKGAYLGEILARLKSPRVREIRRLGLMVGIDLREKVKPYIEKLQEAGVLALPAGPTVLRLLPPLTIGYAELERVGTALEEVLHG